MTKRCFIFIGDDGLLYLVCDESRGTRHKSVNERLDAIMPPEAVEQLRAAIDRLSDIASKAHEA